MFEAFEVGVLCCPGLDLLNEMMVEFRQTRK